MSDSNQKECFVIMPISDAQGYADGHFTRVFEDLITPACLEAGFRPVRADSVKQTNLIHIDILNKLLESPLSICDLSTRNPNVLFELGLRQAFDKPVVLIQEKGTQPIFDITPLRYTEYSRDMSYRDVLRAQQEITEAIKATEKAGSDERNVNSIVRLLTVQRPAVLPSIEGKEEAFAASMMKSEMNRMWEVLGEIKRAIKGGGCEIPARDLAVAVIIERMDKIKAALSHGFVRQERAKMEVVELLKTIDSELKVGKKEHDFDMLLRARSVAQEVLDDIEDSLRKDGPKHAN